MSDLPVDVGAEALADLSTFDYFMKEAWAFKDMNGLRGKTVEQREQAFGAITLLWLNLTCEPRHQLTPEQAKKADGMYYMVKDDFERRWKYFILDDFSSKK